MPQIGLQAWGRGQGWESRFGGQWDQDCVQQGAGEPCRVGGPPHYYPSVGDAGLVEITGVFEGDSEDFR